MIWLVAISMFLSCFSYLMGWFMDDAGRPAIGWSWLGHSFLLVTWMVVIFYFQWTNIPDEQLQKELVLLALYAVPIGIAAALLATIISSIAESDRNYSTGTPPPDH
jgi:hypothetical protein